MWPYGGSIFLHNQSDPWCKTSIIPSGVLTQLMSYDYDGDWLKDKMARIIHRPSMHYNEWGKYTALHKNMSAYLIVLSAFEFRQNNLWLLRCNYFCNHSTKSIFTWSHELHQTSFATQSPLVNWNRTLHMATVGPQHLYITLQHSDRHTVTHSTILTAVFYIYLG